MPKTFSFTGYEYTELSDSAKETAKQWYLDNSMRNEIFEESSNESLKNLFPKSELKVHYSLSSCQGDGLNIEGTLNLYDFIDKWTAEDKEKRTIEKYLNFSTSKYRFESNDRYGYSCKFVDRKYIKDVVSEVCETLKSAGVKNIKYEVIKNFYTDMLDYFEALDHDFEKAGYDYLTEVSEEEMIDSCTANEWYFTEEGSFIS